MLTVPVHSIELQQGAITFDKAKDQSNSLVHLLAKPHTDMANTVLQADTNSSQSQKNASLYALPVALSRNTNAHFFH